MEFYVIDIEDGEEYLTFSDTEETGSFGITAIYW